MRADIDTSQLVRTCCQLRRVQRVGELLYRSPTEDDHPDVVAAVGTWWTYPNADGRGTVRVALLPRLFFQHFSDTSVVVHDGERLVGFLIGFLSQSRGDEAYIHFVGVDPSYRGRGLGADLYERFFAIARSHHRQMVRAITSASNVGSQGFHRRMGFCVSDPIANYDGQGGAHVVFSRTL